MDILQNFAMHLYMSMQTHNKVYEKLHGTGPDESSTQFMADTVKAVEKHKLLYPSKRQEKSDEVIWKIEQNTTQNKLPRQVTSQTRSPTAHRHIRASNTTNRSSTQIKCYNCSENGHVRKDCKTCSYCKIYGHTAKK